MAVPFSLALAPGVDSVRTPLQVGKGVCASNLIRHKNKQIQKRGGCTRLSNTTFTGFARALLCWDDLDTGIWLAIGTSLLLEVYQNGEIFDISPTEFTSNLTTPFTTTAASSIVTVADGGFSPEVGQEIQILNATYIDGLYLQGTYQVLSTAPGTWTFDAGANAIAGVAGGGAVLSFTTSPASDIVDITLGAYAFPNGSTVVVAFDTAVGGTTVTEGSYTVTAAAGPTYSIEVSAVATGADTQSENGGQTQIRYNIFLPPETANTGAFGEGLFGEGLFGVGDGTGTINLVEWSLAKWGSTPATLMAAYAGGTIYQWTPPAFPGNPALPVTNAPQIVNGIFVAAPEQQLFAFGAYSATLGEQDPLLLAWCDIGDSTVWTPSATNQAGSFHLSSGSTIVSGTWFGLVGLAWTDVDLWSISYIGFPLVYGFNQVAQQCGLIGPNAWAILGSNTVAWMGQNDFFLFQGGAVDVIPCTVRDFVFNNLDRGYVGAIHADSNTWFDEIVFRFPTIGSRGVCNAYVCWNSQEKLWDFGMDTTMIPPAPALIPAMQAATLSAWTDQSPLGPPIGGNYAGILEQFETSNDFDGQVLTSSILSGWFQTGAATVAEFWERIIPDFGLNSGGQIQVTFFFADYLPEENSAYPVRTYGPFPVTADTPYFILRGRARFCRFLVESVVGGTFWRYGEPLAANLSAKGGR